jgi:signal transduction histidine kinase
LLCAYPIEGFGNSATFKEVCELHTRVIPAESYTSLTSADDRLRAITELQQKAAAEQTYQQQRALELNETIVQGLAAAKMALELEEYEMLEDAVAATLERAVDMVSKLLGEASANGTIVPGDLRGISRSA